MAERKPRIPQWLLDCLVPAESLEQFLTEHRKYRQSVLDAPDFEDTFRNSLETHRAELKMFGITWIDDRISKTGKYVAWRPLDDRS